VYELTMPSSHKTTRITAIVQSIFPPSNSTLALSVEVER